MTASEGEVTVERLDLKPEWVQRIGPEREDILGPYLVFLLLGGAIFTLLLFSAGTQMRFLGMVLTIWIALTMIFAAKQKTKSISSWTRPKRKEIMDNVPLRRRGDTIERALNGLKLSQILLERRLRRGIMEKVKDEKDLSETEMKKLMKRPNELKKVIDDDFLTDFLLHSRRLKDIIQEDKEDTTLFDFLKRFRRSEDWGEEDKKAYEMKIKKTIQKISNWGKE